MKKRVNKNRSNKRGGRSKPTNRSKKCCDEKVLFYIVSGILFIPLYTINLFKLKN